MCQSQIVLLSARGEETIMKEVIHLRVEGEIVWLSRFFEEPVAIHAKLEEVDFLKHTVTLKTLDQEGAEA